MKKVSKLLIILNVLVLISVGQVYAEGSNEPIHWGFKKGKNGKQADAGLFGQMATEYGAVYMGDPNKKEIFLTFDNGYENGYTEQILDVLKKEKVPATFFVTGHYLKSAEDLVIRMVEEGHIIGNHSYNHPDFTKVSDERLKEELERVQKLTYKITGQKHMAYVRPPRGVFSERTINLAKELGYTHVFWSLAFVDWHTDSQKGWKYAYDNIMAQIHPGAVLLLHTVSKDNAEALERAIQDLKKQGYEFKTLDDLMAQDVFDSPMLY